MYSLIRHEHIFDPEQAQPVIVVGCGATGSHIALQLFSYGITQDIYVIDYDTVEPHNLPNQIFLQEHLYMSKINSLYDFVVKKLGDFAEDIPDAAFIDGKVPESFDLKTLEFDPGATPVVILCVDTMEARKEIVDSLKGDPRSWHIIDTRMAASHGNIYSFDLAMQVEQWERTLFSDELGETSPCGAPLSVMSTIFVTAGLATWEYLNFCIDPLACTNIVDFFLKPLAVSARQFPTEKDK